MHRRSEDRLLLAVSLDKSSIFLCSGVWLKMAGNTTRPHRSSWNSVLVSPSHIRNIVVFLL